MAGTLSSSIFLYVQNKFENRCITLFTEAYHTSINNQSIALDFDENDITAILHNYVDENKKRKHWRISTNVENFNFDKTITPHKGFAAKLSRIDLRFTNISWRKIEYIYYVEAKNLKTNDSALKRRYIDTGIDNFLRGGKYEQCNGILVGYILEGKTEDCKDGINKLLKKDYREAEFIFQDFSINYQSNHSERTLKHLFFEFTN
ncbi:hypothetical protein DUT90_12315 [Polaribacter sp. WD7]|uniref:hypothetical protein n=1 Tax=Polaribacter sp. WD7 TaxID=2269061 RepID=UPI000DF3796F|nr:hypothetical protein [Polaribacter sp. WD7]RCS26534.1 hypothetical protein DUT90_12315 [Polaribacter sp. WD7]